MVNNVCTMRQVQIELQIPPPQNRLTHMKSKTKKERKKMKRMDPIEYYTKHPSFSVLDAIYSLYEVTKHMLDLNPCYAHSFIHCQKKVCYVCMCTICIKQFSTWVETKYK